MSHGQPGVIPSRTLPNHREGFRCMLQYPPTVLNTHGGSVFIFIIAFGVGEKV